MLIVLEGLDGSGKSTQVGLLRKYLRTVSEELKYIHFPRYDTPVYGDLIGKFLRGGFGSIRTVHPQLVALLYAEDRHAAAEQMRHTIENGGTVLLDRYVYSNIAYQCAKMDDITEKEALRQWIINTEYGHFRLPKPDLNIFLDVPIDFIEQKLDNDRKGPDREYLEGKADIHEEDIDFQKKVRKIYLEQCEMDDKFIRIDCSDDTGLILPPDFIFEKIRTTVDAVMK